MDKPTADQVAWVFKHLVDHLREGGTFRYLIYDRMGFLPADFQQLYEAGGQAISNALYDHAYKNSFKD